MRKRYSNIRLKKKRSRQRPPVMDSGFYEKALSGEELSQSPFEHKPNKDDEQAGRVLH